MRRRTLLGCGAAASLAGCGRGAARAGGRDGAREWPGGWVGASAERGHRVRGKSGSLPPPALTRRAGVIVVGAGIAGLSAARALSQAGIDDVQLLELEDAPGGNSRGHAMAGMACPLGAHYLPVPGPQAGEVTELLEAFGLMRWQAGRWRCDERHLCHSPQERLFVDGAWVDGLLPPAPAGSRTMAQYRRFSARVAQAQRELGFAIPTHRAPWTAGHAALDAQAFSQWLDGQGLDDARLRWYLDYCCRHDYGAGSAAVSAWAGLHYFASRHGFHAPGDEDAEREPVFTWPEGNAWLARRLAAPLADRVRPACTVLRVSEGRHEATVLAWDEAAGRPEAWSAPQVVLAVPLFVAARLLDPLPPALAEAAQAQRHAPWLVANLLFDEPLLDRPNGAPPSWDNVACGADPRSLGYVDAMHQSTRPAPGATVLSAYWALPVSERRALWELPWQAWARRVVADLAEVHPDLPAKLRRADLMRYGHAMSIPVPGLRGSAALQSLQAGTARVRFAHADLAAYSVFEEAYVAGQRAAQAIVARR
jgi:predicted NAD/FAD-dependent oxidoreductase